MLQRCLKTGVLVGLPGVCDMEWAYGVTKVLCEWESAFGVNGVMWKWCGSDGLIDKVLDVLLLRELFAYFEVGSTDYVMTEKEKMLAGVVYSAIDEQLLDELNAVKEIIHEYNLLAPSQTTRRLEILKGLLGNVADDEIIINQPFYCDYGKQISVGRRFFANFHLTILDEARVTIGDDCFIGPNVSIYTACHSTDPVERNSRREWAEPVTIGDNVWIGGRVTILPGVTIGNNVTIGAGSVVTKDIPDGVVAVGNPCRVVRNV